MIFNKFKKNCITGLTCWKRLDAIALFALVLLFWLTVGSGLSTSSLAQPTEPTGSAPAASEKSASLTSREMHWLSQHDGLIRIGITVIPPQVLHDEGQYKGLSIDYIHLMERKLGCAFKLVPFATWNEVIQAAKIRRIDMIFAAQQTPERLEYLRFTEPYIELPNMIVVRKDRKGGTRLKEMKGWRVATSEGSAVHEYLKREFPHLDPYPVPDELSGLMKVSVGEADAMVVEISRASYYIERAGIVNLRVAGNAGLLYRLRFAVRSDWPVLCGILDKGLAAITDDERRDITRRWIVVGAKSAFADKAFWIPFAAGLALISLIVTGVILWNRTLSKVVRRRTSQLQQELGERRLAQEALRESEEKYRRIVDTANEGILVLGPDNRTTFANARMTTMLGYGAEEVIGRPLTDFMFEADVPDHQEKMAARRKGVSDNYERRLRRKDGGTIRTRISATPVFDEARRFKGSFGMFTDITNRKQVEEKILRSDQRLRLHSEQSPLGFLEWDDHFCAVEWNAACERIFGYTRDEAIGRHAKDLILPAQVHELVDGIYQSLMNQTGGQHSINENVTKDGRIIICEWFNTTLINKDGKAIGVASVCRDITKQKRLEEELARHREHLEDQVKERTVELEIARNKARQYLDIAGVILVAIDNNRRVTLINQKGCEVLQSTSTEIIGKDWFETFVPQNQRQKVIKGFEQLMAGELEPVEYFENSVLTQDGRERLVAWHNVLLRDGQGHITGTLSSGEDITESRHADKQIIRLNQDLRNRAVALEAANKELDAFAYTVSHDLRAPLRHIDGFLEMLLREAGTALNEKSQHYMDAISQSAQKMGLLIDDLLSFSRMRRHAFSFQQVEMGLLVQDVIRELEPDAAGRTIEWRIGDLPFVNGDERMLRIVLTNLISNALKFTRTRPQAWIEIGSLPDQDAESVIFVRDNGVGFDMSYEEKLFGVFQRLHRADDFEGTGIGLASVRRIIARHGGRTWAQGDPDQGAAFYFALPRTLPDRKEGMG